LASSFDDLEESEPLEELLLGERRQKARNQPTMVQEGLEDRVTLVTQSFTDKKTLQSGSGHQHRGTTPHLSLEEDRMMMMMMMVMMYDDDDDEHLTCRWRRTGSSCWRKAATWPRQR
jgi:hypothetical protein